MHVEEVPNAVARAVPVVPAAAPQRAARPHVQVVTCADAAFHARQNLRHVRVFPAQEIKIFDPCESHVQSLAMALRMGSQFSHGRQFL